MPKNCVKIKMSFFPNLHIFVRLQLNAMRTVAFLPRGLGDGARAVVLPHPRSGARQTFLCCGDAVYELARIDRPHASFFVGDECVGCGGALAALRVHPAFLMLPVLARRGKQMLSADELFADTELRALGPALLAHAELLCDAVDMGDGPLLFFSEEKASAWIVGRVRALMERLPRAGGMEDKYRVEVAFDIVKHYIDAETEGRIVAQLRALFPGSFCARERAAAVEEAPEAPAQKGRARGRPKEKGSVPITAFFKPVKAKK